jgi:UDP-N-acetylmuramate dehydrogenase
LKDFEAILKREVPLASLTSFRTGGRAEFLFEPRDEAELAAVLDFLSQNSIHWKLLGGGTNVLAPDEGFRGAVIRLSGEFRRLDFDGPIAVAGAAVLLAALVSAAAEKGLSGAECLAGIPGTVGGALVTNAGGKWGQIGSLMESVTVFDRPGPKTLTPDELSFGYRRSSLKGEIVLGARLALEGAGSEEVPRRMRQFLAEKRASQPLSEPSAGCVFRNPPGDLTAGALIDKAGLKGYSVGGAAVSPLHANYIVNAASATSGDVRALIDEVRSRVRDAFDVELDLEIELW